MTADSMPVMARLWHTRRHGEVEAGMLAAIAAAPDLPGARCRGSTDWDWDPHERLEAADSRDARLAAAADECSRCPALAACRTWLHGLPESKRPVGITAGELWEPTTNRRRSRRRAGVSPAVATTPSGRHNHTPKTPTGPTGPHRPKPKEEPMPTVHPPTTHPPASYTFGNVCANVHPDGRMVIDVAGAPCPTGVEDLDAYHLLGRIQLAAEKGLPGKFSVLAIAIDTGKLCRFYVCRPRHPSEVMTVDEARDDIDWLYATLDIYNRQKALWDTLIQLPEIITITIGTVEDLA